MRVKGINYDTGLLSAGTSTHEPFDPDVVRREMRIMNILVTSDQHVKVLDFGLAKNVHAVGQDGHTVTSDARSRE
jgi:serine/threonine protein kinase